MRTLWAEHALTASGWQQNVQIAISDDGRIAQIKPDQPLSGQRHAVLLPAPGNLHSHAFQRAMAGLTETRGKDPNDSFWTWRKLMYDFLELLTPDDIEAIAAFAQMEMLTAGYAAVGEFHYVHHQPGGQPYDAIGELSDRIFAARQTSGIGLTHLPVLYAQGGCDARSLQGGQLRFGNSFDQYGNLVAAAATGLAELPDDCALGVAPHSLRAVSPVMLDDVQRLVPDGPVHIHIAEQHAEVAEVLAHLGARPVEWLLGTYEVDQRWCLIHATQMTATETTGLARSHAVAGLCPITESSLGDGIFDGVRYLDQGGRFGLGSDSNIRISLSEEIRTLEYSQRLRDHSRAAFATNAASVGRVIYENAAKGAAQALGRNCGTLEIGKWADIVEIRCDHVDFEGLKDDKILDAWLFARDDTEITNLWSAGRHLVVDGQHVQHANITGAYRAVIRRLRATL